MTAVKPGVDEKMQEFEQTLRSAGIKVTHQRMEIFREIISSKDHPDAETVYRQVKERIPAVSLDTVYRALWLFCDLGLIDTLGSSKERTRFDGNTDHHHHFVCSQCGLMLDFYSEDFNELILPDSISNLGHNLSTHVEVRGVCKQCSEK